MQIKDFEDLGIWRDARLLTKATYQLTKDTRFAKDFALHDQIRRAAVSIMSNLAVDSSAAAIKSLSSFSMSPRLPAVRCGRKSTSLSIKVKYLQQTLKSRSSLSGVYPV